jgi:hypothetical protein
MAEPEINAGALPADADKKVPVIATRKQIIRLFIELEFELYF